MISNLNPESINIDRHAMENQILRMLAFSSYPLSTSNPLPLTSHNLQAVVLAVQVFSLVDANKCPYFVSHAIH